ncbi:MAG: RNA-directed DNA polymerase [Microcoleaceae cyanobacterium]
MVDYYSFHPDIASAYTAVHEWLAKQPKAEGYKKISRKQVVEKLLEETLESAAAQYYYFFPTHYFKVIYTLENIVTSEKLLNWISTNQHICLIDVGCGAGAATIAFLEKIISFREKEKFKNSLEIVCIAIDKNPNALAIYKQFMEKVKNLLARLNITLIYQIYPRSLQERVSNIIKFINDQCNQWGQPCISNAILLQSNVISGFKAGFDSLQEDYKILQELGITTNEVIDSKDEFGIDEARVYKWLFEDSVIDNLHIITVGTQEYSGSVTTIVDSLKSIFFESGHIVEKLSDKSDCKTKFKNPYHSKWWNKEDKIYESKKAFHVNYTTVINSNLQKDKDWEELIDLKNLEMAWVRARKYLKSESLPDENEYRLFEINLGKNLERLQQQLKVYIKEVVNSEDNLDYKFPKNLSQSRLRSLSRLEGEILSTAIIQNFPEKTSSLNGNSYAYRISSSNSDTEYLYNPWFTLYRDFIAKVRDVAQKVENQNGVIICVDIESFYTRIIQARLIELTGKELTESRRIHWLLKILLSKNLDEHKRGYGITQGSIGSGFYANLYLKPIDAKFGTDAKDNEWNVRLIRYVDDIILIIPDKNDEKEVLEVLKQELEKLGLKLNESKTERYDNISEFIETLEENKLLEQLDNKFNEIVNLLWICNHRYRQEFIQADKREDDNQWWYLIKIYQKCLRSIHIYIDAPDLSRRIYKYLRDERKRQKELKEKLELKLPTLIDDINEREIQNWAIIFQDFHSDWIEKKDILREELIKLFIDSWKEFSDLLAQPNSREKISRTKKLKSSIRFAFNKLSLLGLEEIKEKTVDILCEQPWIFSNLLLVLENLSKQGYTNESIVEVIAYYQNNSLQISEYIRAVALRAVRFSFQINKYVWEKIVEYSVGRASTVEKLMATESWLYLGHLSDKYVEDSHIKSILDALRTEQNNRLKKNYILILGMYDNQRIIEESIDSSDYMLKAAYDIALEGSESVQELLSNEEPKVIREKYYSTKRFAGTDGEVDLY